MKIRIVTRKSSLALWQANWVKLQIEQRYPDVSVELIGMVTEGDTRTDIELNQIGGKSLFVKELQAALLNHKADIAVHSLKDMSVFPTPGLNLAAVCAREDPRDVLISNSFYSLDTLPKNALVGTSSPRRQFQLKSIRPDLIIKPLRGNVETRLSKLDKMEYCGIILASAGIKRLGLQSRIKQYLEPHYFVPAIGQGALGIECREDDLSILDLISCLNHWETHQCVLAERAVNRFLGGDCYSPIGAYAWLEGNQLMLQACFGSVEKQKLLTEQTSGLIIDAEKLGTDVGKKLLSQMTSTF